MAVQNDLKDFKVEFKLGYAINKFNNLIEIHTLKSITNILSFMINILFYTFNDG